MIGATKSAWDVANAFSQQESNGFVHMIIRELGHGPVWMAPPYVTPLLRWLEKVVPTRCWTFFGLCIWGTYNRYHRTRAFLHGTAFGRWIVGKFWGISADNVCTMNGYNKHTGTRKFDPWSNPMFLGSEPSQLRPGLFWPCPRWKDQYSRCRS